MDDLRDRFGRLDRIEAPDLWNEAVERAAELGAVARRPMSRVFVLIAAALLLVALAGAIAIGLRIIRPVPPDSSNVTYSNGMIAAQDGCGRLIGIDPASSQAHEVVPESSLCGIDTFLEIETAWSSDGRRLAYGMWRECGGCGGQAVPAGAWVYDFETDVMKRLGECPEMSCKEIDISPDGSLITYFAESLMNGRDSLVVVGVDSEQSHVIALPGEAGSPAFSPDGSRIVLPLRGGVSGLYVVDATGIAQVPLDPTLLYSGEAGEAMVDASNIAWSPDGAWIAFDQVSGDGTSGVWVVRADGTDARLLASGPAEEGPGFPTWSSDSRSIGYVRTPSSGGSAGERLELWIVGVDGGPPSRIYQSECCIADWSAPAWSPDGEFIAFGVEVTERPEASGTAIIRPDGTDLRWASDQPLRPDWQPLPNAGGD